MPITAALPPQTVRMYGGFDYVTLDEKRHRMYAAHSRSQKLLIVDTQSDNILGQVDTGPMHGVAVDPGSGVVYVGAGSDQRVRAIDPITMRVVGRAVVPGNVDGIAYDPTLHRVYADEDNGDHVYVVDTRTMKQIGTVTLPTNGGLEGIAVNPQTHRVYQNLSDRSAFAIIDGESMKVVRIVQTPQLKDNHPLVVDPALGEIFTGGKNGIMAAYTLAGEHIADGSVQPDIDQCSIGERGGAMACAGEGVLTVVALTKGAAPKVVGRISTGDGIHTIGFDEGTGALWVVWSSEKGDFVQRYQFTK